MGEMSVGESQIQRQLAPPQLSLQEAFDGGHMMTIPVVNCFVRSPSPAFRTTSVHEELRP